jgi:hypothetical protein
MNNIKHKCDPAKKYKVTEKKDQEERKNLFQGQSQPGLQASIANSAPFLLQDQRECVTKYNVYLFIR